MKPLIIEFDYSDLSSRSAAARVREAIEGASKGGSCIKVELKNVRSISPSYADEVFGILAERHGVEWIIQNLEFIQGDQAVLRSIAKAIQLRQKTTSLKAA